VNAVKEEKICAATQTGSPLYRRSAIWRPGTFFGAWDGGRLRCGTPPTPSTSAPFSSSWPWIMCAPIRSVVCNRAVNKARGNRRQRHAAAYGVRRHALADGTLPLPSRSDDNNLQCSCTRRR